MEDSTRRANLAKRDTAGSVLIWILILSSFVSAFAGVASGTPETLAKAESGLMFLFEDVFVLNNSGTIELQIPFLPKYPLFGSYTLLMGGEVFEMPARCEQPNLNPTFRIGIWGGRDFFNFCHYVHSNVTSWRVAGVFDSQNENLITATSYISTYLCGWDAHISALSIDHIIFGNLNASLVLGDDVASFNKGITHKAHLIFHRVELPLHGFPLSTIDVGLNYNDYEHQETQRVSRKELNALGQIGEENAKEKQGDNQSASTNKNQPQPSTRGTVVLLTGLAGIGVGVVILWQGLDLYWG